MIVIYGIKNCDSCKRAIGFFADRAQFRDIRNVPLTLDVLERFFDNFGNQLINTRSKTWKALSQSEKLLHPMKLLQQNPTLMKRPVVECSDTFMNTIGWNKEIQKQYA